MQYQSLLTHDPTPYIPFAKKIDNPDLIWVKPLEEKTTIGIEQVHALVSALSYKPVQETCKIAIISPADALTLPAQQALLKTLEEPPENTQIILATDYPNKLLPTILSRTIVCHPVPPMAGSGSILVLPQTISACLKLADEWSKSRPEALANLQALALQLHEELHRQPTAKLIRDLQTVLRSLERAERNVNLKLLLDTLFFSITMDLC